MLNFLKNVQTEFEEVSCADCPYDTCTLVCLEIAYALHVILQGGTPKEIVEKTLQKLHEEFGVPKDDLAKAMITVFD